jgi:hypothetical protein
MPTNDLTTGLPVWYEPELLIVGAAGLTSPTSFQLGSCIVSGKFERGRIPDLEPGLGEYRIHISSSATSVGGLHDIRKEGFSSYRSSAAVRSLPKLRFVEPFREPPPVPWKQSFRNGAPKPELGR